MKSKYPNLVEKEEEALRIAAVIADKHHRGEATVEEVELMETSHQEMTQVCETSQFTKNNKISNKSSDKGDSKVITA